MSFDLKIFADKLHRYREQFQLTQYELSSATGISENMLNDLEQGIRLPTGDEILILADFYKCDYNFFISNEKLAPFETTETLFRIHGKEISKNDRWAIQEFLFLSECEAFLNDKIGIIEPIKLNYTLEGNYFKKHGADAAYLLRKKLGYKKNEISLDIYSDFRKLGIHIFRRKLENSNISGLFIKHPLAGKCVLVNYTEDIYRQRFTVAHEVGHALFDDNNDFVISYTNWKSDDLREIRANSFASHYLLPREYISLITNAYQWNEKDVIVWANRLKVNTETLAISLKENNQVNNGMYKFIKSIKIPKSIKIDPELPSNLSPKSRTRKESLLQRGLSSSYVKICIEAYRQNIISASRMAEMLIISEMDLINLLELYSEKLNYAN